MKTRTSTGTVRRTAAILATGGVALLGVMPTSAVHAAPVAAATPAPARASLPTSVPHLAIEGSPGCSGAGTGAVTCNLYARAETVMVDSTTSLDVWVFDDVTDPGDMDLLNPVIEIVEGDTLDITLDNIDLPVNVSLSMPVVPGVPDSVGIGTADAPKSYSFSGLTAGTYLYQAGPTPTSGRQIAMGMAGVVIVRPAAFETDGTPPAIDLVTTDDGLGVYALDAVVADDDGGSGIASVEWHETETDTGPGPSTPLALTGGTIPDLASGDDITISAVDVAGNSTTIDVIVGVSQSDPVSIINEGYTNSHRLEASRGNTAFLDEILAVTNEFDPDLNASPLGYDIAQYSPTIFTINGQSHEGELPLPQMQAGTQLLVRSVNVGLQQRRIGFAGTRLTQHTAGSRFLTVSADVAAVTLPPGEVADSTAVMPIETPVKIALFDHHLSSFLDDNAAVGGQVQVWELPGVGDPAGPKVTGLRFADEIEVLPGLVVGPIYGPNDIFDGNGFFFFQASVESTQPGTPQYRFFVDDISQLATQLPSLADAGTSPFNLIDVVPTSIMDFLANGEHVLWVQAGSADGSVWGPVTGLIFEMDQEGPVIGALAVSPSIVNDAASITVTGTADTTLTGPGSPVQTVTYAVDGQAPTTITAVCDDTVQTDCFDGANPLRRSFAGKIDTATAGPGGAPLAEGGHTITILAQDSYSTICCANPNTNDHWSSSPGTITFTIDSTEPSVESVSILPNPNDGTMAFPGTQTFLPAVRLEATISDGELGTPGASGIVEAEYWIVDGTPEPDPGEGGALNSTTAQWGDLVDSLGESCDDGDTCTYVQNVYTEIALADIRSLAIGDHVFKVRGRDAAGNWSDPLEYTFTITAPLPTLDLTALVANEIHFSAVANTGVTALVEWWYASAPVPAVGAGTVLYADPVPNPGSPEVSGDITGLVVGDEISVRAVDSTGVEAIVTMTVVDITAPVVTIINDGPHLTFTVADETPLTTLEWFDGLIDPAPEVGLGTPIVVAPGTYSLQLGTADEIVIRAVDSVGLMTEAGVTIQPDVEPPVFANVTSGPNPGEVTFDVTDPLPSAGIVTVQWRYGGGGGGGWTDATADLGITGDIEYLGLVLTGLDAGRNITIRVFDGAGNGTTTPATTGP